MPQLCYHQLPLTTTRRGFLQRTGMSFGTLALGSISPRTTVPRAHSLRDSPPSPARPTNVIHILPGGAPSHLDNFDFIPTLEKLRDQTAAGFSGVLWPSPFMVQRSVKARLGISELFPNGKRMMHNGTDLLCHPSGLMRFPEKACPAARISRFPDEQPPWHRPVLPGAPS